MCAISWACVRQRGGRRGGGGARTSTEASPASSLQMGRMPLGARQRARGAGGACSGYLNTKTLPLREALAGRRGAGAGAGYPGITKAFLMESSRITKTSHLRLSRPLTGTSLRAASAHRRPRRRRTYRSSTRATSFAVGCELGSISGPNSASVSWYICAASLASLSALMMLKRRRPDTGTTSRLYT